MSTQSLRIKVPKNQDHARQSSTHTYRLSNLLKSRPPCRDQDSDSDTKQKSLSTSSGAKHSNNNAQPPMQEHQKYNAPHTRAAHYTHHKHHRNQHQTTTNHTITKPGSSSARNHCHATAYQHAEACRSAQHSPLSQGPPSRPPPPPISRKPQTNSTPATLPDRAGSGAERLLRWPHAARRVGPSLSRGRRHHRHRHSSRNACSHPGTSTAASRSVHCGACR